MNSLLFLLLHITNSWLKIWGKGILLAGSLSHTTALAAREAGKNRTDTFNLRSGRWANNWHKTEKIRAIRKAQRMKGLRERKRPYQNEDRVRLVKSTCYLSWMEWISTYGGEKRGGIPALWKVQHRPVTMEERACIWFCASILCNYLLLFICVSFEKYGKCILRKWILRCPGSSDANLFQTLFIKFARHCLFWHCRRESL